MIVPAFRPAEVVYPESDGQPLADSTYLHAQGQPGVTPYTDVSDLLRGLQS